MAHSPLNAFRFLVPALTALTVVVVTQLALAQPLRAQEIDRNRIRLGGDYERLTLDGFRQCKRRCDRDPRCKAWTFIKTTGQCRLKRIKGIALPNRCCVSGVKTVRPPTETAEVLCAEFASQAVDDYEQNLVDRCRLRGPLWHGNYNRHYRRCLRLSPRARRAEAQSRKLALEDCVQIAGRTRNIRCDHYARISVAQNETNERYDCGLRGELWSDSVRALTRWCEGASQAAAEDRIRRRERLIRRCLSRGGRAVNPKCREAAKRLVALNDRQIRLRCGYGGFYFHSDRDRHYRWCLDQSDSNLRTAIQNLEREVRKCERRRKRFRFFRQLLRP